MSLGQKIKGTVNAVHGIGENIRGTTLGAVDTMAHEQDTKNDDIAQKGRLQTEKGFAQMRNQPEPANALHSEYPKHHRDDEVFNDHQAQRVVGQEYQDTHNATQPGYQQQGYQHSTGLPQGSQGATGLQSGGPQYSSGTMSGTGTAGPHQSGGMGGTGAGGPQYSSGTGASAPGYDQSMGSTGTYGSGSEPMNAQHAQNNRGSGF